LAQGIEQRDESAGWKEKKGIDDDMSTGIEEEEEVCAAGILKARQQRQPI
jgi:hypothetical protein